MRTAPVPVTAADAELLRTDPRAANPAGWRVDWADGPWPVKVLDGGVRRPADGWLGRLLFHTFAVSRVRADAHGGMAATPGRPAPAGHASPVMLRRPVPSGGSMYPAEVYVAGDGVHHYDPYRHELVDLGRRADPGLPAVCLVLTHRFWKNFYKYGDFAYRLGAVDVGVALGRVLRLAGTATLWTAFDDERIEAALGLDGEDEAAYAVVALPTATPPPAAASRPPEVLERSRHIRRSARFDALHRAARIPAAAREPSAAPAPSGPGTPLPQPSPTGPGLPDMLSRTCAGARFDGRPAGEHALADVLHHTAAALDLPIARGLSLYVAVHRVTGVPGGWYRYRPDRHDLLPAGHGHDGGTGRALQEALFAASLNIELAAFTVHIAAPAGDRCPSVRGWREQQMATGIAVEAITVRATAAGLSGHPVLGFDVGRVERAYGLTGDGIQAQVSVGSARPGLNWEVSVMPR
jgi:SagB-type dehydrogenase family enzyme